MGMYWWFPLCPFKLNPVDPSFTPFLRFRPCIAVKWKPMHWNISLLVLDVTTIGSDAPGKHNCFFCTNTTQFSHLIRAKMKKMSSRVVPETTSRHATRAMPCRTQYWAKHSSVVARFLKFQQATEKRIFNQIDLFFRRTTKLTWTFQLGE